MNELEPIQLNLEISDDAATSDEVDRLARHLLAELREMDVESAELATGGPVPEGAKSAEIITAGTIALSVLPAALPKLIDFVQSWALRGGRTVKFKGKVGGQAVEFEGSADDLQALIKTLQRGKRK